MVWLRLCGVTVLAAKRTVADRCGGAWLARRCATASRLNAVPDADQQWVAGLAAFGQPGPQAGGGLCQRHPSPFSSSAGAAQVRVRPEMDIADAGRGGFEGRQPGVDCDVEQDVVGDGRAMCSVRSSDQHFCLGWGDIGACAPTRKCAHGAGCAVEIRYRKRRRKDAIQAVYVTARG